MITIAALGRKMYISSHMSALELCMLCDCAVCRVMNVPGRYINMELISATNSLTASTMDTSSTVYESYAGVRDYSLSVTELL